MLPDVTSVPKVFTEHYEKNCQHSSIIRPPTRKIFHKRGLSFTTTRSKINFYLGCRYNTEVIVITNGKIVWKVV